MPQISTGTKSRLSQISTRMVMDATGVACTAVITGATRASKIGLEVVSTASSAPSTMADTAPSRILPMDTAVMRQNCPVQASCHSRRSTCTGVGSSRGFPMETARRYHAATQNRVASRFFTARLEIIPGCSRSRHRGCCRQRWQGQPRT